MKMQMKLHEFISSKPYYRHSKRPTCRCCDLSDHMATTLIENFKKISSETCFVLMVSKFKIIYMEI